MTVSIWAGVDRLLDRARGPADVVRHRLEPLAARRLRERGLPVPAELVDAERRAAVVALAAPAVLAEVRAACSGPIVVLKGPEAAARYPDPALRSYGDLDLLVPDADEVQRALVRAGFRAIGDPRIYLGIHHLRPLRSPSTGLHVEVHATVKWPERLAPPPLREIFARAVPAAPGVDGVLGPLPAHHAVLLAAHGWAHVPLRRLRDLVDVAATAEEAPRDELAAIAAHWGASRLWRTATAAADALLRGAPEPVALRLWARHLARVRERTVLENHAEQLLSPFWALPPARALGHSAGALLAGVTPKPDEPWRRKLARGRRAVRNARRPVSEHERELDLDL